MTVPAASVDLFLVDPVAVPFPVASYYVASA